MKARNYLLMYEIQMHSCLKNEDALKFVFCISTAESTIKLLTIILKHLTTSYRK